MNDIKSIIRDIYSSTGKSLDTISEICAKSTNQIGKWTDWLTKLKKEFGIEIIEYPLYKNINPALIAIFLTEDYQRPKPIGYQPLQLILKISVLAPVYMLYFDNLDSAPNKRLIRINPISDKEQTIFEKVTSDLTVIFGGYNQLNLSDAYLMLANLHDISKSNDRKPYLDEYLFGLYLSIHPHDINIDQPTSEN